MDKYSPHHTLHYALHPRNAQLNSSHIVLALRTSAHKALSVARITELSASSRKSFDDALAMANDHQYGLASVLFSNNYRQVMQASNEIEAGELYINRTPADPYQGYHAGWKRSGLGGDDGKHGMLEFTQTRLVVMPY